MKIFLTLTSLKYLVRKTKNQSGLKKKLREILKLLQFKIIKKEFEEKTKREMQKSLWFEINNKEFEEWTGDIYNNQDNNDFKIVIKKELMVQKTLYEVSTRKTTKWEVKKLYNKLIQKDTDTLEREKNDRFKNYNVLNILNNVGSIFTGAYLHYKNMPKETMFERSIEERIKLRTERLDEIKRKEQNISNELLKEYFTDYQSPSNM